MSSNGFFYVIQLAPDIAPQRFKLGWASSPIQRLSAHRTAAPSAQLVQTWPCHQTWERPAIVMAGRTRSAVSREVLDCADQAALIEDLDVFFADDDRTVPAYPARAPQSGRSGVSRFIETLVVHQGTTTGAAFAQRLGISPQFWSDLRRGRRALPKALVRRWVAVWPDLEDAYLEDVREEIGAAHQPEGSDRGALRDGS